MIHTNTIEVDTTGERGNRKDPLRPVVSDHDFALQYSVLEYTDGDETAILKVGTPDDAELSAAIQSFKDEHGASEVSHPDAAAAAFVKVEENSSGDRVVVDSDKEAEIGKKAENVEPERGPFR